MNKKLNKLYKYSKKCFDFPNENCYNMEKLTHISYLFMRKRKERN